MGIEKPGRSRRLLQEGIVSDSSMMDVEDIVTQKHWYVNENGTTTQIVGKMPFGNDEVMLMLAGGGSRLVPKAGQAPVIEK